VVLDNLIDRLITASASLRNTDGKPSLKEAHIHHTHLPIPLISLGWRIGPI